MELVTEPGTRCSSCGLIASPMIKFSRSGPVCKQCLIVADTKLWETQPGNVREAEVNSLYEILRNRLHNIGQADNIRNVLIDRASPSFFENKGDES